jgi:chitinase
MAFLKPISAQKVAGFFPDWLSNPTSEISRLQLDYLTDIYYAFLFPNTNGNLAPTTANGLTRTLQPLVTAAHAKGVKVHVSIGGANSSGSFSTVVANAQRRATFVTDLENIFKTYNIDGVDIDWEFPAASDAANLALLMGEIKSMLTRIEPQVGKKLLLSMAVAPLVWNTDGINSTSIGYADFINVMAFDASGGCCVCDATNHSSYAIAERALKKWTTGLASSCGGTTTGKNTPAEKLVIAIPFYSNSAQRYRDFSNNNPSGFFNDADGIFSGQAYNSCPLIQDKAKLVMETYGGAGLWTWELSQDRNDEYSLTRCMYNAVQQYACATPEPDLGSEKSLCGVGSLTLNSNVQTATGRNFTWRRGTTVLVNSSSSANTLSVNQAGTYSVEVTEDGCSKSAQVVVTATLPAISLGDPVNLCSPSTATLTVNTDPANRTIVWQKNNQVIPNASSTSLLVNSAGNYSVTVSATGCSAVNASVNVTSDLPVVENDTICKAGVAELQASTSVDWFANQTGGNALFTGTIYTPNITSNTTFWVEAAGVANNEVTTMKTAPTAGWQSTTNPHANRLVIAAPLTIKSIDVNAQGGMVKINIVESDGVTMVKSKTFNNVTGLTTLDLNFDLLPGTYYLNAVGSTSNLLIEPGGGADYVVPNYITISGRTYDDWSAPYGDGYILGTNYGYFYNMKLLTGSVCDRVPVQAIIDPNYFECLVTSSSNIKPSELDIYPNPSNKIFTVNNPDLDFFEVLDINGKLIQALPIENSIIFGEDLKPGVYIIRSVNSMEVKQMKIIKK